jgi:protein involved in polysaccharide export with SLBB domain
MNKSQKCWPSATWLLFGLLLVGLISGCGTSGTSGRGSNQPPTRNANITQANPDILTEGDRIVITYSGMPGPPSPHIEQIRQDGTIQPPYLTEPITAAGLTTGEFRNQLMALYVPNIFTRVSLTVKAEERYFTIDGEVNAPGLYPYIGTMTVLDGIASARGLNDFAKKTRISITRVDGESVNFNYNKARDNQKFDIPLYPGDIINAPRRLY